MTFATRSLLDGQGRALRFDFSTDGFSSIYARYSDVAGKLDGSNWYSARVAACGALRRGFGQQRIAAAGQVDVVFDNTDGALDWMADRTSLSTLAKLRVRIYLCLYDLATPTVYDTKQIGEYVLQDWPRRDSATIRASFADDVLGSLSQGVQLPTLQDWGSVGNAGTNPLFPPGTRAGQGYNGAVGPDTPIQVLFGEDWHLCMPPVLADDSSSFATITRFDGTTAVHDCFVPVCVTTDTGTAASQTEISNLRVQLYTVDGSPDGPILDIPKQGVYVAGSSSSYDYWTVYRSPSITKDGKSFVVIFLGISNFGVNLTTPGPYGPIAVRSTSLVAHPNGAVGGLANPFYADFGGYPPDYAPASNGVPAGLGTITGSDFRLGAARVSRWWVKGLPLSARTNTSTARQHAADVLKDIVTYYTKSNPAVDATSVSRVKAFNPNAAAVGALQPWTSVPAPGQPFIPPAARLAVSKLCQSADMDVFMNWAGQVAVSADINDFTLAAAVVADSITRIPEERTASFSDWIPSEGERGSPFNQLTLQGGKDNPAEGLPVPFQGPWTLDASITCAIASADRIVPVTLEQSWRPYAQQQTAWWSFRQLDVQAKPRIRFVTDMGALNLDLGDFFRVTWTRGQGAVYSATVFQVEAITYSPKDDAVQLEAIWRDDVAQDKPYLLDNQSLALRVAAAGGRTCTLTDASSTVAFSAGSLITDGVAAGDILRVEDGGAEADDIFYRNRTLRITSVTDATHLVVADELGGFIFGSGGSPYTVTTWAIYRGATTYHTAVSDPTNYPSGGDMYGKVTIDSGGLYSNGSTGNRLLSG